MEKSSHSRVDIVASALAHTMVRHNWGVLALTVALLVISIVGLRDLQVSTNYRAFFGPGNEDLAAFEEFEATFTRNDNFLFALQAEGEEKLSAETLDAIAALTQQAWQIPFAIRVDSLTNFQNSYAVGDELIVEDLFSSPKSMSAQEIAAGLQIAADEPLLAGKLISRDGRTAGVNVTLQYSGENLEEVSNATAAAREIKAAIEKNHPGIKVALTGVSALNNAFADSTIADAMTLFPLMFLTLIIVIWFSVRSITGTVSALLVVTLSTAAAMGLAGFMGISLSPFSGSAPVVILTLALADCMHIFVSARALLKGGADKRHAIVEAYRENFLAVTVTSLTTVVGFLALNFSDAPPFNDLGNIVAAGIFFAWVLSLSFCPALLSVLPMEAGKHSIADILIEKKLAAISRLTGRHYRAILALGAAIMLGLGALIPKIDLNDPWVDYFDEKVEFRKDTEFVMENLTGLYLVEFSIPTAQAGGVNEPEYLQMLDDFGAWLRGRDDVSHVQSYADIIKRVNRNMHGDDDAYYSIPGDKEEASQYLLLYELSLPYGLDLNDRINIDKSATRLTVTLPEISTRGVRAFIADAERWMADHAGPHSQPVVTGAPVLFAHISERNIQDMFTGNVVAVLLIAAIISLSLFSLRFGVLSLLPNIAPIVSSFGIWALLVGEVGMAAATVSATSLGIIVDNTVHILIKYRYARRWVGMTARAAVEYALETVGHAVIINTVILTAGFGVLALSTFRVTGQMGSLTALVIAVAFIVDLILLPSMLLFLAERKSESQLKGDDNVSVQTA